MSQRFSGNPFTQPPGRSGSQPEPDAQRSNPTKEELERKISDLGPTIIPNRAILEETSPTVSNLTVQDLNDLALEFSGVDSYNARVKSLSIEDLRGIEAVFFETKIQVLQSGGDVGDFDAARWSLSCCSCTPCCCCAAADTDPFADADAALLGDPEAAH